MARGQSGAKVTVPSHRSSMADLTGTQALLVHALGPKGKQEVTTTFLMPILDSNESPHVQRKDKDQM